VAEYKHMKKVEIFKTNIPNREKALELTEILNRHFPKHKINFDLEDCDRILRIEGKPIGNIGKIMEGQGVRCEVLE
jgi:hypothetical protein